MLASVHVFVFSAAFPFFGVVDEQIHLDQVIHYSHGNIPREVSTPTDETLQFIAAFGTVEYLWPPSSQPGGRIAPPPWKLPINAVAQRLHDRETAWRQRVKNHEAAQPPLYYSVAAAWWHVGKFLKLDGLGLLYWLRFLNAPLLAAAVWLGWFAARKIFPENQFIQIAVPALIAFMPQTIFYAVNNDILSPLTFGFAFVLLMKLWQAEAPGARLGMAAGLALAATYLTKISNLPLLGVSGIFIAIKIWRLHKERKLRAVIPAIAALVICAGAPTGAWMIWCKIHFGDFTGSESKIQYLGWTHKSFTQWFSHPIFTPHGFWIFLSGNLQTFWQGELLWQRKPLALPVANWFYSIASIVFIAFALCGLKRANTNQKMALRFAFAGLIAMPAFFGFLSVIYDFQNCFYPSRQHPYFTSGRLLLGALIPFMLLFVFGLDCALKRFSNAVKFSILAAILVFMLTIEIATDWPVFPNDYNWYHM